MKMKKIIIFMLILIIAFLAYYYINYEDNTIKIAKYDEFKIIVENDFELKTYIKSENYFNQIIYNNKIQYLPIKLIKNANVDYDFDFNNKIITLSNREKLFRLELDNSNIKIIKDEVFIDSKLLEREFNIKSYYSEENKLMLIKNKIVNSLKGKINKETFLYKYNNVESDKTKVILLDDIFTISEVDENWYYGYNENFEYGYIKKDDLKNITELKKEKEITDSNKDKIIMTWDQIYSYLESRIINKVEGLNVISPTWYKLTSDSGDFSNLVSKNYINSAKDNNYKIWPLVSNTFGDIEMTSRFLNNSNSRKLFIENLLIEFEKYEFDGINIDFENIYMKDKDKFTQFISELSYEFSKKNIIISVDVTVMGGSENWSLCYDRLRISELVDYLVIMTYDEHWASSKESGSVASYNWVKDSLNEIIENVDSEKIIMGIPLFTRIWYEVPSTTVVNQMDVTSKTITLKGQENLLNDIDVKPIWDEESKQFFVSYIKDSKVKKVWLEEEISIKEKTKLVNELNLAGVAMWSKGFETENIWEIISDEVGD